MADMTTRHDDLVPRKFKDMGDGTFAQVVTANVANSNTNGQATMASSSPVVIASNQSAVPVEQNPSR